MKGGEFQKAVAALPGYVATDTGSVYSVKEFLERMDQASSSDRPVPRRPGERP
jgi:hypothetical protein